MSTEGAPSVAPSGVGVLATLRDDAERLLEDSWELRERAVSRRELVAESVGAALFFVAAAGILVGGGGLAGLSLPLAATMALLYGALSRIRFAIGVGSATPLQLGLVPMLLLLPVHTVPLLAMGGIVAAGAAAYAVRRTQPERILFSAGDSWYTLGPAAVLLAAGARPEVMPAVGVLVLAFVAGLVVDLISGTLRETLATGVRPELQVRVVALAWVADVCLAPIGLLAASAAMDHLAAAALMVPCALLLVLLNRDRNARIEEAQQRLELVRRERTRLQSAVRRLGESFAARLDMEALLETVLVGSIEALDAEGGKLDLRLPTGARHVLGATTDDLEPAVAAAAAAVARSGQPEQMRRGEVWALAVPFAGEAVLPSSVSVVRRDREFGADEIDLLAELVQRAGGAAAEIMAHQQLRTEVATDPLTQLGNRRRLQADLDRCVDDAVDHPTLLMLFDMDGFKRYNDRFGHPAGDDLLSRLGGRLTTAVGDHGRAYRLGGDEFCVLLRIPDTGLDAAIDDVVRACQESGPDYAIDASCGAVLLPHEADDPGEAMRLADERMYAHKAGRRAATSQVAGRVRELMTSR
jgi:diguanylate cyclase (GGDEF)-like protein